MTDWTIEPMSHEGNQIYLWQTTMAERSEGAYYYLTTDDWENYQNYRETVPGECAEWYDSDRGYLIRDHDVEIGFKWSSCEEIEVGTSTENRRDEPLGFELHQNFPNPFNPSTIITYRLPKMSRVRLSVFNVTGRKVARLVEDKIHAKGIYNVNFNAGALASGVYIYRLEAGGVSQTRKLLVIK
ncbi:T9SS type A sorting domain-containing protein [Rhodohalobacter sp. 8-1]|uniref:T9SS type A sorting domain-containing protein n=1 Tax=Rhodohalobacter sp. 8-1 TaxID=3131972 RepID=UPI0030EF2A5C